MSNSGKQADSTGASNRRILGALLTPSWLSGLVVVVASLAVMTTTIAALHFPGSGLQLLLNDQSNGSQPSLDTGSLAVSSNFSSNELVSDIPLFVLWGCVGLLAYSFIMNLSGALRQASEFRAKLDFTNIDRQQLVQQALQRLALRAVVLVAWVLFIELTIHVILPYAVALTQFSSSAVGLFNTGLDAVLAFAVLVVCLHVHTIMLRLLLLKPRVFFSAL